MRGAGHVWCGVHDLVFIALDLERALETIVGGAGGVGVGELGEVREVGEVGETGIGNVKAWVGEAGRG